MGPALILAVLSGLIAALGAEPAAAAGTAFPGEFEFALGQAAAQIRLSSLRPRKELERPESLRDLKPKLPPGFHLIKESARFSFYSRDPKEGVNLDKAERCLDRYEALLGQRVDIRIHYFHHEDMGQIAWQTGLYASGVAIADYGIIHSTKKLHEHEIVHIVSAHLGDPGDFFKEGLAVALGDDAKWGRSSVHSLAERLIKRNPKLGSVELLMTQFLRLHENARYPLAGSFVKRLIQDHSLARVADFFRRCQGNHPKTAFSEAFGITLEDAEKVWLKRL